MKRDALREQQAQCKAVYAANPAAALQTLTAEIHVDFENLACQVVTPTFLTPAGLHPAGGGDGSFACPVEIMLAGLATCAGTTLSAVATSMKLDIQTARIRAEGDLDFRGTLAVDRASPVGLTALRLAFDLQTEEPEEKIQKLLELTHRYCVVHRTFDAPPPVACSVSVSKPKR